MGICAAGVQGADWPQWGGRNCRNMVSAEKGLPATFALGRGEAHVDDVLWTVKLGPLTYGHPAIAGGRVFLGTGDRCWGDPRAKRSRGGLLLCIDEKTGKMLWRLLVRRYKPKVHGSGFDDLNIGICSCPTVEGDRAYVVTNRAEVLCLDVRGQANGNDGPFQDEGRYMAGTGNGPIKLRRGDADIVWRFDMIGTLPSAPHDATNCNVLVHGELLYVCTSNGVHRMPDKPNPLPEAPSLIVLHKRSGRLVAADGEKIGRRLFHGQWSSPSLARAGKRELILFGAGDGVLYAFEPAPLRPGTTQPAVLKKVWQYDCNPQDYKFGDNGWAIDYWDGDASRTEVPPGWLGPSEIIGTPVAHRNRVYVAVGRDPHHGAAPGILHCIDATGAGDITRTGCVWSYRKISRTMATVSVADGLLYIPDIAGAVHCLDADTGRVQWVHQTAQPIWSSTLVADGKVYVTTEKRTLWVFQAGRQKRVLATVKLPYKTSASPVAANGVLYIASHRRFYAVRGRKRP
ncbi:MAG: hypothetical protein AMS14_02910 [Planctomycetes bacterium DG_20]|nr:MAG: hypothetical protein AMS14_02910 [Planctomycetes bacterium DG_20]